MTQRPELFRPASLGWISGEMNVEEDPFPPHSFWKLTVGLMLLVVVTLVVMAVIGRTQMVSVAGRVEISTQLAMHVSGRHDGPLPRAVAIREAIAFPGSGQGPGRAIRIESVRSPSASSNEIEIVASLDSSRCGNACLLAVGTPVQIVMLTRSSLLSSLLSTGGNSGS